MCRVWNQLLAELRALGVRVVYANFHKITIATEKRSLDEARTYIMKPNLYNESI